MGAGIAPVLGFFLPFIDLGGLASAFGWEILAGEHVPWMYRLAMLALPVGGLALIGAIRRTSVTFAGCPRTRHRRRGRRRLGARSAPLVCTSGHLRAAARVLLRALAAAGACLRVQADMDVDGLHIAARTLTLAHPVAHDGRGLSIGRARTAASPRPRSGHAVGSRPRSSHGGAWRGGARGIAAGWAHPGSRLRTPLELPPGRGIR